MCESDVESDEIEDSEEVLREVGMADSFLGDGAFLVFLLYEELLDVVVGQFEDTHVGDDGVLDGETLFRISGIFEHLSCINVLVLCCFVSDEVL